MAKKNNVRHKPELAQQKNIDRHVGEGISSKDFIVLNDGKIGINLPENIIGELGSIDPRVELDVVGGARFTSDLEVSGYGIFGGDIDGGGHIKVRDEITGGGYLKIGGDIDGGGHLRVKDEITGGGYLRIGGDIDGGGHLKVKNEITGGGYLKIGGDIDGGGHLKVKDEITGGGYLKVGGDIDGGGHLKVKDEITGGGYLKVGGDIDGGGHLKVKDEITGGGYLKVGGDANIYGDAWLHNDLTLGNDFLVSGDSSFLDTVTVGDPFEQDIATFAGSEITLGSQSSGVLAEFDDGIKFYERPTVSGTGVLLIGEIDSKIFPKIKVDGNGEITGDLSVGGNLYVSGDTFVQSVTDVSVTGDISGYSIEGVSGIFETGIFQSGYFQNLLIYKYLDVLSGITSSGYQVLTEADTGIYDTFYLNSNPSNFISEAEAVARFTPTEPDPFCFFYDAENHRGNILKTYYPTEVSNRPETILSGISVSTARDITLKLRFHGPDYTYIGSGFIDSSQIPVNRIEEYGTGTRAFNGSYRSNFNGETTITGEANGRQAVITIHEFGEPRNPTGLYIDLYSNSIPRPGENQGTTALKSGDKINVFAEFDHKEIGAITILQSGISQYEQKYYNREYYPHEYENYFNFTNDGGITYLFQKEITVSNEVGDQGFAVKVENPPGDESNPVTSIDIGLPSGVRLLNQDYPSVLADIATNSGYYSAGNGLHNVVALHYDFLNNTGSDFIITGEILNWDSTTDSVTYTKGIDGSRDRYNLYDNITLNSNSVDFSLAEEVLSSTGRFGTKAVQYSTGFHSEEILRISGAKASNGATNFLDLIIPIENGPQVSGAWLDSVASDSVQPNIIGTTEIKGTDTISGFAYVSTKGILDLSAPSNPEDFKYHVQFKLEDYGITEGSDWFYPNTVEHYCDITKAGSTGEMVLFGFDIDVTELTSRDTQKTFKISSRIHTSGNETNAGSLFQADTIQGVNNYISGQYEPLESNNSEVYKAGYGSGIDCDPFPGKLNQAPPQVNNSDYPQFSISLIDYPLNQSGLKGVETGTIFHTASNYDNIIYSNTGFATGQIEFTNAEVFEAAKSVQRTGGGYNVDQNNFIITGIKTSNGMVRSIADVVNIADTAPTYKVCDLPTGLSSIYGAPKDYHFFIQSDQIMVNEIDLAVDPTQINAPNLTKSIANQFPTEIPNNFIISVLDENTRGEFNFEFTGSGIGGQVSTTLINPEYIISGFESREIYAPPQSLSAGLAEISGVNVFDPSGIILENTSKGGTAPSGGTFFEYQYYADGIQMGPGTDIVDKFTTTNSQGLTTGFGATHIFNLDKLNRAANAALPGAKFLIREE